MNIYNQNYLHEIAKKICNHIVDGKNRALTNASQRRNHAGEFMKPNPDGSKIIDLDKIGVDLSSYGIDISNPNFHKNFKAEQWDMLSVEDQDKIKSVLIDHIEATIKSPDTRFSIASDDGSKIIFNNVRTSTNIIFDASHPDGGTMVRGSSKLTQVNKVVRGWVRNIPEELKDKFNTPNPGTTKGPYGMAGGIYGAIKHYKKIMGFIPNIALEEITDANNSINTSFSLAVNSADTQPVIDNAGLQLSNIFQEQVNNSKFADGVDLKNSANEPDKKTPIATMVMVKGF